MRESKANNEPRAILRIAGVLRRHMDEHGLAGYKTLERKIAEANGVQAGKPPVHRNKLRVIVESQKNPSDFSLRIKELLALDTFLAKHRESLADKPLFEMPTSLRALVASGHLTFVLGSHPRSEGDEPRTDVTWWDVRAMGHVLRAAERMKTGLDVEIKDVAWPVDAKRKPLFLKDKGRSVCCIGSPRACRATEFMLATMLRDRRRKGDSAFLKFKHSKKTASKEDGSTASAFEADIEEIRRRRPEVARDLEKDSSRSALVLENNVYVSSAGEGATRWEDYGVVVAQRRSERSVWMVVAGLTGPATFGCAEAVVKQETSAFTGDVASIAQCDAVRTRVRRATTDSGGCGDPREVVSATVVRPE